MALSAACASPLISRSCASASSAPACDGLDREDLLVRLRRALGRADLLGERARAREEELDPARRVAGDRGVLLVERARRGSHFSSAR